MGQRNQILLSPRSTSAAHLRRVGQGERVAKQEMWEMKTIQNYCKLLPLKIENLICLLPKHFESGGYHHPPGFHGGGTLYIHVYNSQVYIKMYG